MEEENKVQKGKGAAKEKIPEEEAGKRTPPATTDYITGGDTPANRPEQGPDIHPHERTEGIP